MTASKIQLLWFNSANWKWHIFYYCKEDPRVIVPRLTNLGWTINFASPLAIPALLAIPLFLFAPFYVLEQCGIDVGGYDWPLLFVIVFFMGLICARLASLKRYEKKFRDVGGGDENVRSRKGDY